MERTSCGRCGRAHNALVCHVCKSCAIGIANISCLKMSKMHRPGGILQVGLLHFRRSDNENVAYELHSDTTRLRSDASPQTSVQSDMHKQPGNLCLHCYLACVNIQLFSIFLQSLSRSRLPKRFLKNGNIIRVRIKIFFPVPKECIFTSFAVFKLKPRVHFPSQ